MKDKELHALFESWPAAQPSGGFADRVLVAVTRPATRRVPARRQRGTRVRSVLAVLALVAATVLVPLVIAHSAGNSPTTVASAPSEFDLGPQQD